MGVQAPGLAEEAGEKEGSKATSRGKETKKKAARKRDPKKSCGLLQIVTS
jgi:hypothetical protein